MNTASDIFKTDFFKPENLFSANNPFVKSARQFHQGVFAAFDGAARAHLSLAEDLMDLNRKRVDALYSGKPLSETFNEQKELTMETGKRLAAWGEELRDVAIDCGSSVTGFAADWLKPAAAKAEKPAARKSAAK